MRTILTILAALVCSVTNAQQAVITGPTEALPGELVVLDSFQSDGVAHLWITPEGLSTAQAGCDQLQSQIFFATPRPGRYTFFLVVADKEPTLVYASHTVTVGGVPLPPPVDPGPIDPPPPPISEFAPLVDLSFQNSKAVNDEVTRAALAVSIRNQCESIDKMCSSGQCPGLDTVKSLMVKAIEDTLLRSTSSINKGWAERWRVPNNEWLRQNPQNTVPSYLTAMRAIATGLEK